MTQFHPPARTEASKSQSSAGKSEAKTGKKQGGDSGPAKKPGSLWPAREISSEATDHLMRSQHKNRFNIILLIVVDLALLLAFGCWYFYF